MATFVAELCHKFGSGAHQLLREDPFMYGALPCRQRQPRITRPPSVWLPDSMAELSDPPAYAQLVDVCRTLRRQTAEPGEDVHCLPRCLIATVFSVLRTHERHGHSVVLLPDLVRECNL